MLSLSAGRNLQAFPARLLFLCICSCSLFSLYSWQRAGDTKFCFSCASKSSSRARQQQLFCNKKVIIVCAGMEVIFQVSWQGASSLPFSMAFPLNTPRSSQTFGAGRHILSRSSHLRSPCSQATETRHSWVRSMQLLSKPEPSFRWRLLHS